MIILFKKMAEKNTNLSIKEDKLVFKLETEGLEDVFVGITVDEVKNDIDWDDLNTVEIIWKLLFEKAINKYHQARTQLIKKC